NQELRQLRPDAVFEDVKSAQMQEIKQLLHHVELARAVASILEVNRYFHDPFTAALHHQLETNLVSKRIEVATRLKGGPPQREETRHGVADGCQRTCQQRGHATVDPAEKSPVVRRRAALDIT